MDDSHSINGIATEQCAPRVYQHRDGRFVVVHDEGSVSFIGKLTVVPDRTAVDRFEDALSGARKMLEDGIAAGVADDALALFDCRMGAALKALREALKR